MTSDTNWAALAAQRQQAETDLRPHNRDALFDALMAASITAVTIEFDGSGDEGQVQSVLYFRDETEMPAPTGTLKLLSLGHTGIDSKETSSSIGDAIESVVYDLLDTSHGGWQDGDGAYGDFRFEVGRRTIALSLNARFTDSQNYQYEF